MKKLAALGTIIVTAIVVVLLTPFVLRANNGDLVNQGAPGNFGAWPVTVTGGISPAATLKTNTTWFVDTALGSDSNTCLASGATACKTIQAAVKKAQGFPYLAAVAIVSIAAGNYTGASVAGLQCIQPTSAGGAVGFVMTGTMQNFAPATGTATGTASATSAGASNVSGTLTDGTQTWTVNNLRGQVLLVSGVEMMIDSNTATVITIRGSNAVLVGTPAYTIEDWGTVINASVAATVGGTGTTETASGLFLAGLASNDLGGPGCLTIQHMRVSGSFVAVTQESGNAFYTVDSFSTPANTTMRMQSGNAIIANTRINNSTASGILFRDVADGSFQINNSLFTFSGGGSGVIWAGAAKSAQSSLSTNQNGFYMTAGPAYALGNLLWTDLRFDTVSGANLCLTAPFGTASVFAFPTVGGMAINGITCTSPTVAGFQIPGWKVEFDELTSVASTGANANSVPWFDITNGGQVYIMNGTTNFTSAGGTDYKLDASIGGGSAVTNTFTNLAGFGPPRCEVSPRATSICAN